MLGTLGFLNKFKHIVALTNETQTMFSFQKYLNSIQLRIILQQKEKKKKS